MKISIICSNREHPVYPYLDAWLQKQSVKHDVELVEEVDQLTGGDLLFLISCSTIINVEIRNKYQATLVIHASDLPKGRGWSPQVWQILQGNNTITISLLEAADKVDSGNIWAQRTLKLEGHELCDEIYQNLFKIELELMDFAVDNFESIQPYPQPLEKPSYYRRRTPGDSRIDPNKTIAAQFNLLRICDPRRYPAFFDFQGYRYQIQLMKMNKLEGDI